MRKASTALAFTFASLLAFGACGSDPVDELANTEVSSETEAGTELISDGAEPIEADTSNDAPTEEPDVEDSGGDTTEDTTSDDPIDEDDPVETCDAPVLQAHFVDVSLDDPDGGLNVRNGAGTDNDVVITVERSGELITSGNCAVVGTVDWWEVSTSDGSITGWASSRFLSDLPVFNPGLGTAIVDTDNVGAGGDSLEAMAAAIAEAYGFDEDLVLTQVGDVIGIDAQGGSVIYEMTGLKDDSSNGYQVEIGFIFDKNEEDGVEIESYTAVSITNYALCTRGVTEDGLCI